MREFMDGLNNLKTKFLEIDDPIPDLIIGGDFNLPHVFWPDCKPKQGCYHEEREMIELLDYFSQEFHLTQYINSPTHKDGNTLDLIFMPL